MKKRKLQKLSDLLGDFSKIVMGGMLVGGILNKAPLTILCGGTVVWLILTMSSILLTPEEENE